jgi:hypothetical protein
MIMKKHFYCLFLLLVFIPTLIQAQADTTKQKGESITSVYPAFSLQWPGGDMAERFGMNSTIGVGFFHKTASNWVYNADINFLFGNVLREDSLIQNLINTDGFVINDQGHYSEISFFERGFYSTFRIGKVIPIFGSNANSGLMILVGGGYMQHKIRIQVKNNTTAPLNAEYKKGYDRFSDGFSAAQFIGYVHMGKSRLANFFIGAELVQSWTKNRRSMNFDTMRRDDKQRFDFLGGVKVGWIIPFNQREPDDYYYY